MFRGNLTLPSGVQGIVGTKAEEISGWVEEIQILTFGHHLWECVSLNYAQIRRSHRRWSCGDSGTRVNSVISQVVFSAVSLPV